MRNMKLRGPIICIAVAIGLLFVKDNFSSVWGLICNVASVLTPVIYGFIIAYILNFPFKFFNEKVFGRIGKNNKHWQKMVVPVSIISTYLLVIGIIALLIGFIVPELTTSLIGLAENLPGYFEQFQHNVNMLIDWVQSTFGYKMEGFSSFNEIFSTLFETITGGDIPKFTQNIFEAVFPAAVNTAVSLINWIMAIIISIYMLISKQKLCMQAKRIAVAVIPIKWLPKVYEFVDVMDTKCGRFLVGKIMDSSIIGLMCFICMSILRLDYAMLISVLVAVCNIIPFFGPFISAIPAAFLLLMIDPLQSLIFIVMIIVLQQIDGNIIGPKIVGSKVGLIGFWTLFSVIVGGGLFGFAGLILGTPVFAAIYTLLGKRVNNKIDEKGNIAQQALEFEVLNYSEIAEEQKRLRKKYEGTHINISKFLQKELDKKKNTPENKKRHTFKRKDKEEQLKNVQNTEDKKFSEENNSVNSDGTDDE